MSCRAPFPSFTTVILSARDSFIYSDYYIPPKRESSVSQPRFRRELDFMKTIDLRDSEPCNWTFSTLDYITEDEELSDEDEYLEEKKRRHGPGAAIFKSKSLIPRFWSNLVKLCFRPASKTDPNEVILNLNN